MNNALIIQIANLAAAGILVWIGLITVWFLSLSPIFDYICTT